MRKKKYASALHDHSYVITSDPLTYFACVFSALIHDVNHPVVPEPQLIKENEQLTWQPANYPEYYCCPSVAKLEFAHGLSIQKSSSDHHLCQIDEHVSSIIVISVWHSELG